MSEKPKHSPIGEDIRMRPVGHSDPLGTARSFPGLGPDESYPRHFAAQARRAGLTPAARFQGKELSYAELDARANRLAHYLRGLGVGPEALVAVCLERSFDLLMALLAVWKAGGAYLPLDPEYPAERLEYMLSDSQAKVIITQKDYLSRFRNSPMKVLILDDPIQRADWQELPETDPMAPVTAGHLAYVIYTSGSTGKPKGVEVTHRALLNHNFGIAAAYDLRPGDQVLQFAPLSFDVSIEEIFPSWLSGGTVILRPRDAVNSMARFLGFVAEERLSVLNLPTAFWHELVDELANAPLPASVRLVVIGGEKASDEAYRKWKRYVPGSVKLVNSYGPTEATITTTYFEADPSRDTLLIGRPIANTQVVILDQSLHPVPAGGVGELYIGGDSLARGYRHQPALTAQRFIPNPLPSAAPSERLYKTGDLARVLHDGVLEFVGRVDEQIKIRGFRIEPGEIEAALLACPAVNEAVVIAREDSPGQKRLVAYYAARPSHSPSVTELMGFLRGKLPEHMVPSAFIRLPTLPLTPAGKVDRRSLPGLEPSRPDLRQKCVAPRTATEEALAGIWRDVLRLKEVGVRDSFLELGGDSLLALQVIARVRDRLSRALLPETLLEGRTIETMARAIDGAHPQTRVAIPALKPAPRTGKLPVSFAQQQLWLLHELHPESDAYNMPLALRLRGPLDPGALQRAFNEIVRRHETLRTSLEYADGDLVQVIAPELRLSVEVVTLSHLPARQREAELLRLLQIEARRPFELDKAPLVRARLFRLDAADHALVVVMHHCISDGWSLAVLLNELECCYAAFISGTTAPVLPHLALQYADYAHWQRTAGREPPLEQQLSYWKEHLAGAPVPLRFLMAGSSRPPTRDAARQTIRIAGASIRAAARFAQSRNATPFMVLLTALSMTLHKWTGQDDLVVGTVVAGRNRREFEHLIGCFMNFLPLRVRLCAGQTGEELLAAVRKTVIQGQNHQECPFEEIVQATNPRRNGDGNPLCNVALLWHNYPTGAFRPPALRVDPIPLHPRTALLDLRFEAEPRGQEWSLDCEYNAGMFSGKTISELLASFSRTFELLVNAPHTQPRAFFRFFGRLSRRRNFGKTDFID